MASECYRRVVDVPPRPLLPLTRPVRPPTPLTARPAPVVEVLPVAASTPLDLSAEAAAHSTVACTPTDTQSEASTHPGYSVPTFHRITVHGSTFPLEWLKLTVSPRNDGTFGPFSWERHTTNLSS